MGSLERHDGYLHNAETIAKVSPKLNIKLHEWNKPSTTDDADDDDDDKDNDNDDSMSHSLWPEITQSFYTPRTQPSFPWHGIPCRLLIVQQANNPMKQPANVDLHRRTTTFHQATTTSPSDPLKFKVATSGCSKWQCRRTNDDSRTISHSPCPPDHPSVYVVAEAKNSFPFDEEDSCAVVIVVVCSFLYLIQLCLCRHFCLQQQ